MARKRSKDPGYPAITLEARVRLYPATPGPMIPQDAMCEMLDVSDRTLREWHTMGMPKETDADGKPVYPSTAFTWAMCYQAKVRASPNRKGPRRLSLEQAMDWHLERQQETGEAECVLVPLSWDHPLREEMLRRAAAGLEPPPEDEL